jgi:5-formyltetrahydrofolate cyclo-ligase
VKRRIRRQALDARYRLSPEERRAKAIEIEARLFALPSFRQVGVIMFFASFQSEVDTHHMIRRALTEGKRVVLPRVRGKELELYEITNFDLDVHPGAWGIPEPDGPGIRTVQLRDVGLIVVPGAAFDVQGNRIGYGGGFYDRLLAVYQGPTAALAFEEQLVPKVPRDTHDVPVRQIVTEKRIIESVPNDSGR